MAAKKIGRLILEDGSSYEGVVFGAEKSVPGEVGKLNNGTIRPIGLIVMTACNR